MIKFIRPKPINNEIILDPSKVIMSKTDYKGVIQYANEYFMTICGYEEYELMGKPHNVIRHPDMPKVIFKFMWERLHKGENIYAIVKNLAKDGSYYWVMTTFETTYDEDGDILAHYARRKAVPIEARKTFEDLYKRIIKIENQNEEVAEKYFYGFIEDSGKTYDELFLSILGMKENEFLDYFQNNSLNINLPVDESVNIDIDSNHIEKKKDVIINSNTESTTSTNDDLQKLKNDIARLQQELDKKNSEAKTKRKGFFGRFFSKN